MDNRPIGIFDSGIGGLSCIGPLMRAMPAESFIFFGDTARAPYGSLRVEQICEYSLQVAGFLIERGAKALVLACNTLSAVTLPSLEKAYPEAPVIGIIEAVAAEIAKEYKKGERPGLIATKVTVESGTYEKALNTLMGTEVFLPSRACPLLVPIIEEGLAESEVAEAAARHYLNSFVRENRLSMLVLACTHYPFMGPVLKRLYPDINLLDPANALADETRNRLGNEGLLAGPERTGEESFTFFASRLTKAFEDTVRSVMKGRSFKIEEYRF